MIKIGLNTWLWANRFEERHLFCIEKAAELGAEVLDFTVNDPFSFPSKAAARCMQNTDMEAVVTTAMPEHCNAISPLKSEREQAVIYIKKLIDIAAEMNSSIIGGVNYAGSGYHSGKMRSKQEIEWDVEYLKKATEYAKQYNIDIAVEPVKRFETHFLNTAEQALELIKLVGADNLKVHLDTFHMNIEEADIMGAIERSADQLVFMHLVDNNRDVPGGGHLPWVDIFKTLKKIGYDGAGCIETFNPDTLEETSALTFLTRRFAESPEALALRGLKYLKALRTMTYCD